MKKYLNLILAAILICSCKQEAPLTFQAGTLSTCDVIFRN